MDIVVSIFSIGILLFISALISASEAAFFNLSAADKEELHKSGMQRDRIVLHILNNPKRLLASILIANNLVNIGIILMASFILSPQIPLFAPPWVVFSLQIILITAIILIFGEVIPKVYASRNSLIVARALALPISVIQKLLFPLSSIVMASTLFIEKNIKKKYVIPVSKEVLSDALELTPLSETAEQERRILRGIVKFGTITVKQIMVPRAEIAGVEEKTPFTTLLEIIREWKYSRIPVYRETLDHIIGILYSKDLLPYLHENDQFHWQQFIRAPLFISENQKNDDVLSLFLQTKQHLAIVQNAEGQTIGLVTMEDILEEIVGDIHDEFDDDNLVYSQLDEHNYVFEGRISLNDFCRKLGIDREIFSTPVPADTLNEFLIAYKGAIPARNEEICIHNYVFTIESIDDRKIRRIKVTLPSPAEKGIKS